MSDFAKTPVAKMATSSIQAEDSLSLLYTTAVPVKAVSPLGEKNF